MGNIALNAKRGYYNDGSEVRGVAAYSMTLCYMRKVDKNKKDHSGLMVSSLKVEHETS
jgi:hypothetical protein